MSVQFRQITSLYDHLLRQEIVRFNVKINANAVPADKILETDIPQVAVLRCQGQTAEADAIEAGVPFTAPNDATGICGLLFNDLSDKLYDVTVTPSVGTVSVTSGLSDEGRPYLNIDSNQNFSTTSVQFAIELKYMHKV